MEKFTVEDISKGLSHEEAKKRLAVVGPNEFEKKREFSVVKLLVAQFTSPLIYILLFAGAMKIFLRDWLDASIILLVVMVNTVLGFWQEFKAARSLEALKSYLKPKVTVLRGGGRQEVLMQELVPGDVVFLDAGGGVPADGVLVAGTELLVNEALLTGESRPVMKLAMSEVEGKKVDEVLPPGPQKNTAERFVYMGTTVSRGLGTMVVTRTGNETEMGKIALQLTTTEEEATPLQQKLAGLARVLMIVVVVATVVIVGIGVAKDHELGEMFETAVAMAVAAIPEGLAVSMTVILALGMQRILKQKALVRKLMAAETLGSVSVICCDKTGTLTEGKMKVVDSVGDRDELVRGAILANDERDEEGLAMAEWARKELTMRSLNWTGLRNVTKIREQYKRVGEIPFSSERKFVASLNEARGKRVVVMVGAPEVVLSRCYMAGPRKKQEQEKITEMARKGYRLIGVACKQVTGKQLTEKMLARMGWHGFLAFEDPVRDHVKESLVAAKQAGVGVKVITGDYKETAVAVLNRLLDEEVGDKQIMTGEELGELTKEELKARIDEVMLFVRTTPDQKLKIVEVLKDKGNVVAMTGDGVNDAPALKSADIGVVVNEATDVSKETADMVLLDSNFRTIVEAIREGRVIFQTMRKVVTYLLTDAFQELILIGGSLLMGLPLPLTAVQILWINLVEDGLPGVALAFDLTDEGVMEEKPRKREMPIIDGEIRSLIVTVGIVANLVLLGLYTYLDKSGLELANLRTFMFVAVGTNSLLYIFSIKSLSRNIWQENLLNNKYLIVSVVVGFVLMMASVYVPFLQKILETVPLKMWELGLLTLLSVMTVGVIEITKWVYHKRKSI